MNPDGKRGAALPPRSPGAAPDVLNPTPEVWAARTGIVKRPTGPERRGASYEDEGRGFLAEWRRMRWRGGGRAAVVPIALAVVLASGSVARGGEAPARRVPCPLGAIAPV